MKSLVKAGIVFSLWGGLLGFGTFRVIVSQAAQNLPTLDIERMKQSAADGRTTVLSADGNVIDYFSTQSRIPVPENAIPKLVSEAFMSAEDQNFMSHHGVDFTALARAVIKNILLHKHEGGSGITQQVVKNLVTGNERSLDRKINEALLAMQLEQIASKQTIMSLYLNSIWFGHGAYGIGAASQTWFQKPVSSLTLPEIAFLAILPRGPAIMDPETHPKRAYARRNYVLDGMVRDGYISQAEADVAKTAPMPKAVSISNSGSGHSYYSEIVRRQLLGKEGSDAVYSGGLKIQTYQNLAIQALSDASLRNGLMAYDVRHGWHGSVGEVPNDWRKGVIKSCDTHQCRIDVRDASHLNPEDADMVAANPYGRNGPHMGDTAYVSDGKIVERPDANGAVIVMDKAGHVLADTGGFWRGSGSFDGAIQAMRQTGSVVKPIVALAATEKGWTPDTIVADVPIEIDTDGQVWRPGGDGKDDGMGMIPLKQALAQSRNQAFVRLGMDIGFDNAYALLYRTGFYRQNQALSPASMLGATETTLIRVTAAYAAIVNNSGCAVHPQFMISEQTDACDDKLPDTSAVKDMLKDVVSEGTAELAFKSLSKKTSIEIGGKTGTSNDVLDSWFVGYYGDIIIGVHVGFDTPRSLGEHEFGSTIAAPIAAAIMDGLGKE